MHDAPGVMRRHVAQYPNAAALHVDLDLGEVRAEGVGEKLAAAGSDARRAHDFITPAGYKLEVERLRYTVETRQQLAFGVLGGEFDGGAGGDGGARSCGD